MSENEDQPPPREGGQFDRQAEERHYGNTESEKWKRFVARSGEPFPRGLGLSFHSPMFWVQNKDRFLRQLLIRDIEQITRRRLCVFFCSPYFTSSITANDYDRLRELIIDDGGSPFDLLLETEGGSTDATHALVELLQSVNLDFRVIIPGRAKSSGTMICLAASDIVMGNGSQLGPIEPFLGDLAASLCMTPAYENDSPPLFHEATHALRQTQQLADRLLKASMIPDDAKRRDTVEKLTGRDHFPAHGATISHKEARELGLRVDVRPENCFFWERCRLLYAMYKEDSHLKNIAKFFEARERSLEYYGDGRVSDG